MTTKILISRKNQDIETYDVVVNKYKSYNQIVECIVQADEITSSIKQQTLTLEEEEKLHRGIPQC